MPGLAAHMMHLAWRAPYLCGGGGGGIASDLVMRSMIDSHCTVTVSVRCIHVRLSCVAVHVLAPWVGWTVDAAGRAL
jgi:hypothetical protein